MSQKSWPRPTPSLAPDISQEDQQELNHLVQISKGQVEVLML